MKLMALVLRIAKKQTGGAPRSASEASLEHFRLEEGKIANQLTPAVFKAPDLIITAFWLTHE
jgi:hypothetical protein